eukprot:COSAG02_NODE_2722_length_8162_cov_5.913308_2_plen_166_part_00
MAIQNTCAFKPTHHCALSVPLFHTHQALTGQTSGSPPPRLQCRGKSPAHHPAGTPGRSKRTDTATSRLPSAATATSNGLLNRASCAGPSWCPEWIVEPRLVRRAVLVPCLAGGSHHGTHLAPVRRDAADALVGMSCINEKHLVIFESRIRHLPCQEQPRRSAGRH